LQNQEDNVHDVEQKYIIDRGTRAVEVQERGRIRGVGPSRGDMEPSYISTIMLKSINAAVWIVRAWWYQRLSEIEIILVPVRHQQFWKMEFGNSLDEHL
jgi:hypothetical protein